MRVPDHLIQTRTLSLIQRNSAALAAAQEEIASGLRVQRASDDPSAASEIMDADRRIAGLNQHHRNIDLAQLRLDTTEEVVHQIDNILIRARELSVSQAGDTANGSTRASTKVEVDALLDEAIRLANTRLGEGYLFGGYRSDQPPLTPDDLSGAHIPLDERVSTEVGAGQRVTVGHNVHDVFLGTNTIQALRDLSDALGANDGAAIQEAGYLATRAHDSMQSVLADIGGKANGLQTTRENLTGLELNLRTAKSNLQDADLAEAMIRFSSRESALRAAMLSTSKMLGMSLTDYLR